MWNSSGVSQRRGGCGQAGNGMWKLLWRESALGWMWTGGKWDAEVFWRESALGWMWTGGVMIRGGSAGTSERRIGCGRGFNEMWNSSGVSPRRGGRGRVGNGMRKLLWREYETDGMWTGGIMGCGSCSGAREGRAGYGRKFNGMWNSSGVNTRWTGCGRAGNGMRKLLWREYEMGRMWTEAQWDAEVASARFARSEGAAAHGLRAQKKREGRASPPLTVHPQIQMSAPASCPCPRPGAGAS